jgi:hypothetical protein
VLPRAVGARSQGELSVTSEGSEAVNVPGVGEAPGEDEVPGEGEELTAGEEQPPRAE